MIESGQLIESGEFFVHTDISNIQDQSFPFNPLSIGLERRFNGKVFIDWMDDTRARLVIAVPEHQNLGDALIYTADWLHTNYWELEN